MQRQIKILARIARSLCIQLISVVLLAALSQRYDLNLPIIVLLQSIIVGISLRVLKETPGIQLANILFPPICALFAVSEIPQGLFFCVAILLILVFYPTLTTGVPLFTSSKEATSALIELLPQDKPILLAELGAGDGTVSSVIAKKFPAITVVAYELGLLSFLILKLRGLRRPNIRAKRTDFFADSWRDYDFLYCFLAPPIMPAVWEKFDREAKAGAVLVSNAFPVEGLEPERVIALSNRLETNLYLYKKNSS